MFVWHSWAAGSSQDWSLSLLIILVPCLSVRFSGLTLRWVSSSDRLWLRQKEVFPLLVFITIPVFGLGDWPGRAIGAGAPPRGCRLPPGLPLGPPLLHDLPERLHLVSGQVELLLLQLLLTSCPGLCFCNERSLVISAESGRVPLD